MAIFFTVTLLVAVVGMSAVVALKRYELRSGRVFFSGARPRLSRFFGGVLIWIEGVLPATAARAARRVFVAGRSAARAAVVWSVLFVEHGLERTLHALRYKTSAPASSGEASPFLREVAEHKRKLLRRPRRKPAVEEPAPAQEHAESR